MTSHLLFVLEPVIFSFVPAPFQIKIYTKKAGHRQLFLQHIYF